MKELMMKKVLFLTLILQSCHMHAMLAALRVLRGVAGRRLAYEATVGTGSVRSMGSLGVRLPSDPFFDPNDPQWSPHVRVVDRWIEDCDELLLIQREAAKRALAYTLAPKTHAWLAIHTIGFAWSEGALSFFTAKHLGITNQQLQTSDVTPDKRVQFDGFREKVEATAADYVDYIKKGDTAKLTASLQNMNEQ